MGNTVKIFSVMLIIVALIIAVVLLMPEFEKKFIYKLDYADKVEETAKKYDIDKYLIFAVIKTESNFNENATSNVGARGLMQIMPDAFDWVKSKLKDERGTTFDDMYIAEYNIEYCTYLLNYLLEKYGKENLAVAAYHAGMTSVDNWLADDSIAKDGGISEFPSKTTNHYVDKVLNAYHSYKNLYDK